MPQPFSPQQRHREETYRGVEISVTAYSAPNGRWLWVYLAGDMQGRSRQALCATSEAALAQGLNAARARVDAGR
jgi:hypothetical protein